jgi:hypothetical protein
MKQTLTNKQGSTYYRVDTEVEAWEIAHKLIDNLTSPKNHVEVGVFRSTDNPDIRVCVMGNRLECFLANGEMREVRIESSEARANYYGHLHLPLNECRNLDVLLKDAMLRAAQRSIEDAEDIVFIQGVYRPTSDALNLYCDIRSHRDTAERKYLSEIPQEELVRLGIL